MAYFSNSTEGEILDAQCADCPLGAGWNDPDQKQLFDVIEQKMRPCPVAFIQLDFNYDQLAKGQEKLRHAMNCLINEKGVCQVREQLLQIRAEQG
jgi:hypothetical protein